MGGSGHVGMAALSSAFQWPGAPAVAGDRAGRGPVTIPRCKRYYPHWARMDRLPNWKSARSLRPKARQWPKRWPGFRSARKRPGSFSGRPEAILSLWWKLCVRVNWRGGVGSGQRQLPSHVLRLTPILFRPRSRRDPYPSSPAFPPGPGGGRSGRGHGREFNRRFCPGPANLTKKR